MGGRSGSTMRTIDTSSRRAPRGVDLSVALVLALALPAAVSLPVVVADVTPLPNVSRLDTAMASDTIVYGADGTMLADLHPPGYQHYYEPVSAMGALLPAAVVEIEDHNFFQEPGIDPVGIARAAAVDIQAHKALQGASTITQQLVKIRLLAGQPTFQWKLREALYAFSIERQYSKSEILDMYLNSVSFGNSAVGASAASLIYFHKKTSDLDLAQAAMLAGLISGPTLYSPFTNWKGAKARQSEVLAAMVAGGKISQAEADKATQEDLSAPAHIFQPENLNSVIAPSFVSYVISQLKQRFGADAIYSGGLRVYTTLNATLQGLAQAAITKTRASLAWRNVQQGALVAIDPTSGAILAMVGSATPNTNGGQYNLAVWPPRNPGSSMKLYTYTAAIASGRFTMTTPIQDSPIHYLNPGTGTVYSPQNYDGMFHGTCQVQQCLGNSLNIPAVKVELGIGVPDVVDMARAMGAPPWQQHPDGSYTNNDDPTGFGPSLTLGGYGETPLQMATGASVLAAQGTLRMPFAISRVAAGGTTMFKHVDSPQQAVDPRVAFIMANMLSNDQNRAMIFGRDSQLVIPGWTVAAKTGTSDSFADAWSIGFTPKLAVAVWMGNPDWRIKMTQGSDSYYVAVPAWHDFLVKALPLLGTYQWYAPPTGIVTEWGYFYLPGTVPSDQPSTSDGSTQSQGGHHHKHGGG